MARYTNPLALYKAQVKRFEQLGVSMREGHQLLAIEGLGDSREILSGTLTPKQTRGAFARGATPALSTPTGRRRALSTRQKRNRGLTGTVPLLPINMQSGKLVSSQKLNKVASGTRQQFDLTQVNPGGGIYTMIPGGTSKMVDRGYKQEIRRRFRPRNKAFIDYYSRQQRKTT